MNPIRKHLSYANVVATLALLFAMSGGALAASHYLINSTRQINPKVLKKLRGSRGPKGPAGPAGAPGNTGARGETGPAGQSGVLGMVALTFNEGNDETLHTTAAWGFVGETVTEGFTDAGTAAHVTVSMDFATDNKAKMGAHFGVCYEPAGGPTPTAVADIEPEFQAEGESYFAQTVSGIVKGLAPGSYVLGACTSEETANTKHGGGAGTIVMAETP
jgi:Collagen triple helix repeat (20 copies)